MIIPRLENRSVNIKNTSYKRSPSIKEVLDGSYISKNKSERGESNNDEANVSNNDISVN